MGRVVEFEGRRIEVPPDATDAEIGGILASQPAPTDLSQLASEAGKNLASSAAGQAEFARNALAQLQSASAPEQPKDADGWLKTVVGGVGSGVNRGVRGAANGIVDTVTLPVSLNSANRGLISWLLKKTGAPPTVADGIARGMTPLAELDHVAGPEAVKGYLDSGNNAVADTLGVERPRTEAAGPGERVIDRVGEMIGGTILPAGAALRVADRVGVEGARAGNWLMRTFVEPAAVNPANYLAKEAGAAVAAGTGAGAANEMVRGGGGQPGIMSDTLGALGGLGTYGLANVVARSARDIARAVLRPSGYTDEIVRQDVTARLAQALGVQPNVHGVVDTSPVVEMLARRNAQLDAVPGFVESLGDRSRAPNVQALEYGRSGLDETGQFAKRRAENTAAIDKAMSRSAPASDVQPGALRQELELERARRLTDANVNTAGAQADMDAVLQRLQSTMTGEARGADIRAALENASAEAKQLVGDAWSKVRAGNEPVDVRGLADRFATQTAGLSAAERQRFAPPEAGIPAALAESGASQPMKEITGVRAALTDAQREAASAGRSNEARVIGQYVDALDQHVEGAVPSGLRADYDAARAATKDFHDRFTRPQTAIAQTLDKREGLYAQPDSGVAAKFVQADEGKISDFQALIREAGGDPRVKAALRDQMLSDVQARGLLAKPAELDAYLGRYGAVMKEFPDLKAELGNAAGVRRALDSAQTSEATILRELGSAEKSGRSTVGKYLRYGDENAEKAMRGVMASADPKKSIDELLTFAGNTPAAHESAKKIFWDILQKDTRASGATTKVDGVQPWNPARLKNFLDDPAKAAVAERIYAENPEHLSDIRKIADAIQNVDTRASGKAPNASGTAQAEKAVLTPESFNSRFFAYVRGQVGAAYLATSIAATLARNAIRKAQNGAISRLLDEALLNPDVAATLLRENNPANRAALAKSAKGWSASELARVTAEPDPVREAVGR